MTKAFIPSAAVNDPHFIVLDIARLVNRNMYKKSHIILGNEIANNNRDCILKRKSYRKSC